MSSSDTAERLPLFEAYASAVADTPENTFDNIRPAVPYLMRNCVSVGLRPDNTLDIPKLYEPEDGPLVLALRGDESVIVRWSEGMEKAAEHVTRLAGVALHYGSLAPLRTSSAQAMTYTTSKKNELTGSLLKVPLFMTLRPLRYAAERVKLLGHEADHWDFFLNEAPQIGLVDGKVFSSEKINTLAERRAYLTQYAMAENSGAYAATFMSPNELARSLRARTPEDAAVTAMKIMNYHWRRQRLTSPLPMEVAVVALSLCFADENPAVLVSDEEVRAYRALGVLAEGASTESARG